MLKSLIFNLFFMNMIAPRLDEKDPAWIKYLMWIFIAIFLIILAYGIILVLFQPNFAQNLIDLFLGSTTTTTIGG